MKPKIRDEYNTIGSMRFLFKKYYLMVESPFSELVTNLLPILEQHKRNPFGYEFFNGRELVPMVLKNTVIEEVDTVNDFTDDHMQYCMNLTNRIHSANSIIIERSLKKYMTYNKTYKTYCEYIDKLHDKYGNLVFLSFNCGIKNYRTTPCAFNGDDLFSWKNKLLKNIKKVKYLEGFVGYIGKWECFAFDNVYLRLILIFDEKKINNIDISIGKLNSYWLDITKNEGCIFESHISSKMQSKYIAINKSSLVKREEFKNTVVTYIVKSDYFYMRNELLSFLWRVKPTNISTPKKRRFHIKFKGR